MPSPKLVPLVLTDGERWSLEALVRKRTASQSLALRARIVLACAEESGIAPLTRVAVATGGSREMVRKWRVRFMQQRVDGLTDAPRPGAPRKITDEQVEVVVTRGSDREGTRPGHALVDEVDGRGDRVVAIVRFPDLAGLRPQAPPGGDLEAPRRPGVHRQGPRRGRPLHEPARARPGPGGG
jgi:hypothetical protein